MIGVITIYPNSVISISLYYSIAIVSTLVWILMHKERIPIVLPSGVFFGILLANGMIIESLIIHIAYNNTLVTAGFLRWIFKTKYKGYFGHK